MSHQKSRYYSAAIVFLLATFTHFMANAQTVVWSDNFESYAAQGVTDGEGLDGDAVAPGVWTDFGGNEPFHIDDTFARTGSNSLRLDEGEATVDDGYGSDAFINLPEIYDSGSYTLTYSMFVTNSVDTYHSSVFGQTYYPVDTIWPRGLYLDHDAQSALGETPIIAPIQSVNGELLELVTEEVGPLVSGRWVDSVVEIDLDNNRWQWTFDGNVAVPFDTTEWQSGDNSPTLASLDLYIGFSFEGADANGIAGSVFYDDFVLTRNDSTGGLICDADGDGDCDHADIDALYAAFGSSGPLDLNGNGAVDAPDIQLWLTAASSASNPFKAEDDDVFVMGDLNLSGEVTSTDLGLLLNNFGSELPGLTWDEGDLNGSGAVDSTDLGLLLNNFGFASPAAAAVPEPGSMLIVCITLLGILPFRRR